ncbi:NUDIX hydrolase [Fusobacterium necrophorum]|uniref:Nudix hydrolase domain-containing protein n=1 Tax=Fusobacterium necrophorum subsp. funduliforme TaxID=143387 RepID=A0A162J7E4_9FUSO|nr:NUDIX hydrolase [Fusobacterium necrophorum]KYL05273.1 hypothetical protein A2J07_00630 [Fusobacterium necrophorum subsp. funduliforme]MDK4525137.1 NUDIX hydrolase [Fusobacterium necrophorum]
MKIIFLALDKILFNEEVEDVIYLPINDEDGFKIPTNSFSAIKEFFTLCEKYDIQICIIKETPFNGVVANITNGINRYFQTNVKFTTYLSDVSQIKSELSRYKELIEKSAFIHYKSLPQCEETDFFYIANPFSYDVNRYIFSHLLKKEVQKVSSVIVKDQTGKILTFEHKKNNWKRLVPSGKLEEGENSLQCAIRELKEEIGLFVSTSDLRYIKKKEIFCEKYNDMPEGMRFIETLYLVQITDEQKQKIKNMEPSKHRDFKWLYPSEIINFPENFTYETWDSVRNTFKNC